MLVYLPRLVQLSISGPASVGELNFVAFKGFINFKISLKMHSASLFPLKSNPMGSNVPISDSMKKLNSSFSWLLCWRSYSVAPTMPCSSAVHRIARIVRFGFFTLMRFNKCRAKNKNKHQFLSLIFDIVAVFTFPCNERTATVIHST